MSEQLTLSQKPESPNPTSKTPIQRNDTITISRSQALIVCAAGLGISFFLPWATVLGASTSGFELQKLGDEQLLLWLIPSFSLITIIAAIKKSCQKVVAQLTGILPFGVGVYYFSKLGSDMQHILGYGAYLSLIFGAALFILPRRMK